MYECVNTVGKNQEKATESEDECNIEGKDRWKLTNVSELVAVLVSQ